MKILTIAIPSYNSMDYMRNCIESLLPGGEDVEILIVDDGSKDDTLEKLKKWEKSQKLNIKVIDQSNSGVSRARNNGIKEAQGEYILFLDSDDWYHENYVEFMLSGVKKADVAYCKLSRKQEEVISFYPKMDAQVIQNQEEAMHNLLYRMGELCFCNYIYNRKTLVEKNITLQIGRAHV